MSWNKEFDKNFKLKKEQEKKQAEAEKAQQAEKKQNTFYGDYKSRQQSAAQGNTLQRAVSENPFTPVKTKVYQSYDDRKKTGNVFIPNTVFGQNRRGADNISTVIPNVTLSTEKKLGELMRDYEMQISESSTPSERQRRIQNVMNRHKDVFDEYKRQTGADLTIPGLQHMYEQYADKTVKQMQKGKNEDAENLRPATLKDLTVNSFMRGFANSKLGVENEKAMRGAPNKAAEYKKYLEQDKYQFAPKNWLEKAVSGAIGQAGQMVEGVPEAAAYGGTMAAMAAIAGNAGPQAAIPEEVLSVPSAFGTGYAVGSGMHAYKVEAGLAYDEMIDNGISPDTAAGIAAGVGGVNAALEAVQLDDLIKSFDVLSKSKGTKGAAKRLGEYILKRGGHIASETAQEVAQEGVTITGAQAANRIEKGEWAYNADEVKDRLKDKAESSTLTFAAMGAGGDFSHIANRAAGAAIDNYHNTVNTGREFKGMGSDVVQSVIDTGKESDNNTSAYKYADKLQSKQTSGKDLSDWNVGRQWQKNVKAIQSENEFAAAMSNIKPTEITDRLYSDSGQELNGVATSTGIKVSSNGSQSVPMTIKHEWSHMFKNLDPTAYNEYEASVIEAARETNNEAVDRRIKHLTEEYGYSREVAREEIVAELTGGFNTMAIQQMAEGNTTLANKMALAAGKAKSHIKAAFSGGKYTNPAGVQLTFEQLNNAEKQYIDGLNKARNNQTQTAEVRYSKKGDNAETKTIKAQLYENLEYLKGLENVAVSTYELGQNVKQIRKNVGEEFKKIGYKVDRQNFGIIDLGEKQINESLNYLNTDAERAALFTVPKVLKRGVEITKTKSHKNRDYDTVTIAAPVEINGVRGIQAVVVKKVKGNRYKTHRIVMPDGSTFEFLDNKTEATTDKMTSVTESESLSIASDTNSISNSDENVKYSVKENAKGKYVQADRQVITSNNSADWEGEIYNYINDKIRNGQDVVIPTDDGDNLTITEKTAWKMGYRNGIRDVDGNPTKMTDNEYRTKLNAAVHIDELAEVSKRGKHNVLDTKNHGFAQDGFNYRTAYFRDLDGQYYRLTISVGENSEQKTVYNIGRIEKASFPDNGSKTNSNNAVHGERSFDRVTFPALSGSKTSDDVTSAKRNSYTDSISKNEGNVKYSVKENAADRITNDIIKENGSAIKKNEIADDVRTLYELLTDGDVTDERYRTAWSIAENIGQRVAQGIQITDSEIYDNYKDLRNTLRNTPISISDADKSDITGADNFNEFRRKNFGSLSITKDGTRIDQFYQELSELYPNFFDAQRETHPADQLMQIEKVLQDIKPKSHGLSDVEINEAAGDIAGKLITDIMNNPSVKVNDSQYNDWDSLMTSEEAHRQEKLQSRAREKNFTEDLPHGRQGRQGVLDELSQDIRQEVEILKKSGSIIDRYNAESASRADRKQFTKNDIIPAIKNYGVGFMQREVDKLYPIKAYERYAQNQIHGNDKVQFSGKESPYVMSSNSIDAESRAKYILTEKLTDFDANEIGESLADIVGELGYDDYRDFNTYLKLKHGLEWIDFKNNDYKPVFNDKILNSYEAMRAGINELEAKHADFEGLAQRVYDYQAKLMKAWLVDTGIITQKQFDILREKYPCYVPFFRQDDTPTSHFRPKKGIANQSNPIMQAEGGGQKIYDPIENIMINTSRFVNAAAKNSAMQAVVNIYDTIPGMEHYMAEVVKDTDGKYILKDKNHQASNEADTDNTAEEYISDMVQHAIKLTDGDIVTVLQDGSKRYFKVFDRYFLNALDNMRPIQSGAVMRAVASATRVFSALATSNNPVFTLASNPIKDTQNAFMQTTRKNPFAVVTAILDAQVEQFKNSNTGKRIGQKNNADYDGTDAYKKYMAMGGEYASAFSAGRSAMKEALKDVKPDKDGFKSKAAKTVKFVPRLYGNVADAIETGPRLGEFKYSNGKAGNDVHQAHFDSKNITLNFGRSGTTGEKINKFVPFYNPSVQGISMMVQNFKNKPFQTSMRVGVGIALSVLLSAFNKRDDESEEAYERASAYLKNNYYLFHIKDGKFIKIPKSQEYGLAPSLVERVIEKYAYDNPDAFYNYADYLSTALLPSLLQAESPFIDTGSIIGLGTYTSLLENKDFKGSPIVPDYLQDEVPEMQYDERTSYIARWIGKELKWSPKKIDYVIKSNTGFLGKINESIGHSGEKDWSMGVSTKFTADSLFSTDKTNMFYENRDEADRQAKSYPSADNEYLSKRFAQSGKIMSILNAMYKENRNDSRGREIRKAYIDYATENKDNPTGYSDEVYDRIKNLFDTDSKVLSLPTLDRTIKAKIGKEDKSYTFNDAESILHYQSDLNKNVDEAYRKLLSDVSFNAMSDIDKVSALSKAKKTATDEVKRFYIENEGGKVMFDTTEQTEIVTPSDNEIGEYSAKKEYQAATQKKIQSVVDNLAKSVPDKAEYYSMSKLTEFDIRSVKIDGKSYDIKGDTLTRVTEAAYDSYYSNVDKLSNNELNIEDIIGYTKKGKAHTATDAKGNKVALTGRMYNSDGTPRFDDLVMAKILEDVKEASKTNAINQYQSEITGNEKVNTIAQTQKKFTTASASGRKSGGGKRGSGSRKSSSGGGKSDVHFTRAMANSAARRNNRVQSIASLPSTVKNNVHFTGGTAKGAKLPNTVRFIPNPIKM